MANLLDFVKAELHTDLIRELSLRYEESEWGISKAISSLAPVILSGLLEKSLIPGSLEKIFQNIQKMDTEIAKNPGSLLRKGNLSQGDPRDLSGQLLGQLFGSKIPAILNAVASFSGVKVATAEALAGITGPLVFSLLHQKIKEEGYNASGLGSYLADQQLFFKSALPASVSGLLGLVQASPPPEEAETAAGIDWFWPLLLLLILGVLIGVLVKHG